MNRTFAFLLSTCLAGALFAGDGKLAKDLESLDPASNVNVIVQFKEAPTEAHHQKIRARGDLHKGNLELVKGSLYSMPAGKLKELAGDPDVAYIAPDRPLTSTAVQLDYFREAVNATTAQKYGWTGTGIGVAVIDSGIFNLGDLSHVVDQETIVPSSPAGNIDGYGHGTPCGRNPGRQWHVV